ncbi:glyoxalase [Brevibacterium daeguense]|nr:glyoxalase [Brevibacterium daeguense]
MTKIEYITAEADDPGAEERFYQALGLGDLVRVRASDAPTAGFRGFTLSLVVPQPAVADGIIEAAVEAGGTLMKSASKSLWGYGGAVSSPDGMIVTVASAGKKNTGDPEHRIENIVLQLGVADVGESKRFYAERGLKVAKSFGRRYVEFGTGPITLTLLKRAALAKTVDASPDGSGSPRIVIGGDAGSFTDPDGFEWEAAQEAAS